MPRWQPFEPYFWSLVARRRSGCWEWTGGTDGKGYGRVCWDGGRHGAHRVSWCLIRGAIPDGLYVCHHCDNKLCVNPDHLFLGTQVDNMQDWTRKGKNKLVNNPALLARGDDHWTRKDPEKVERLIADRRRAEWASGRRQAIRGPDGRIMGTRMVRQ